MRNITNEDKARYDAIEEIADIKERIIARALFEVEFSLEREEEVLKGAIDQLVFSAKMETKGGYSESMQSWLDNVKRAEQRVEVLKAKQEALEGVLTSIRMRG